MSNALFAWPIHSDRAGVLFSRGSWAAALPLANLADPRLAKPARSTDATGWNTQFDFDLGAPALVGFVGIPKHNLSRAATIRVRLSGQSSGPRTNGWTKSQEFDDAAWTKEGVSITANATTAPDGTLTADKLVEDSAVGTPHGIYRGTPAMTASTNQAYTISAKAAERSWIELITNDSTVRRSWFNLATGAWGVRDSGHTARATALGSGWYRLEINWTSASTACIAYARATTGDGVTEHTGDGTSGLYLWGAQFEADASFATSYIPTTTVPVTRTTSEGNYGAPAYDSGPRDVFPVIYPRYSLPWGHPSWFDGRIPAPDVAGYNIGVSIIAPVPGVIAQHGRVEITDVSNPAGFIDLNRLVVASAYQPTINILEGSSLGWRTTRKSSESDGGVEYVRPLPTKRSAKLAFDLPLDEALTWLFEMQRRLGIDKQFYFIFDPDDTIHLHRRSFLAQSRELAAFEYRGHDRNVFAFEVVEVL
jgi:hypothetical protein